MDSNIKSVYRALIYLKDDGELDEAGLVMLIEREEFYWGPNGEEYGSPWPMTSFLRKYRIEQYVKMEK